MGKDLHIQPVGPPGMGNKTLEDKISEEKPKVPFKKQVFRKVLYAVGGFAVGAGAGFFLDDTYDPQMQHGDLVLASFGATAVPKQTKWYGRIISGVMAGEGYNAGVYVGKLLKK